MNSYLNMCLAAVQKRSRAALIGLFSLITVLAFSGCGDSTNLAISSNGQVIVGLTDVPGDFLKYSVEVKALTLTRSNGAVVSVLPNSAMVDFTQYTEMTEFFSAATVPSGTYVKATLTLDYTSADIQVEKGGVATSADVVDSNGDPLASTLDVNVTLNNANSLVVLTGLPSYLVLDFDLASSNSVDLIPATPVVTVIPTMVADVQLNDSRPHMMRGLLGSVNTSTSSFDLALRPLFAATGNFGSVKIYTNTNTQFDIDGQSYTGSSGLNALALEPFNSWVMVIGHFNTATKSFEATEVFAGSSLAVSGQDVVTGVVLARSGDNITVNAGSIVRSDGSLVFNKNITGTLTSIANYTRQLTAIPAAKGDVSVGQRIIMVGTLTDTGGGNLAMNTPAQVRLLVTQISGTVVSDGVELVVNLQHIMGRPISQFTFSGTGSTVVSDADPDNYQVDQSTLGPGILVAGTPVHVRGFVKAFGSADPDFMATTVVDLGAVPATLVVGFLPSSATALSSVSSTQIDLDMSKTGLALLHHVWRLSVATDLTGTSPVIKANTDGTGLFVIYINGSFEVYGKFSDMTAALTSQIGSGAKVRQVSAWGSYDDSTQSLTAKAVGVWLN